MKKVLMMVLMAGFSFNGYSSEATKHCEAVLPTIFDAGLNSIYKYNDGKLSIDQAKVKNYKVQGNKTTFNAANSNLKFEIVTNDMGVVKTIYSYMEGKYSEKPGAPMENYKGGDLTVFGEKNGKCIVETQDRVSQVGKKPQRTIRSFDFGFCQKFQKALESSDRERCSRYVESITKIINEHNFELSSKNIEPIFVNQHSTSDSAMNSPEISIYEFECGWRNVFRLGSQGDSLQFLDDSFGKMIKDPSLFDEVKSSKEASSAAKVLPAK